MTGLLSDLFIRKATLQDIEAILQIETEQFTRPWLRKDFVSELNHDIAYFYVAQAGETGGIMGYILFWIVESTIELHNIAVAATYQGKGVGKKLMGFLLETARTHRVGEVFLEVRQSNTRAIALYESFGFVRISSRKNYYSEPTEDALIFQRLLFY